MHIYPESKLTLHQLSMDALNTATPNLADIVQCIYILTSDGPPLQSSIDTLHTATPNLADIVQCTYILTADGPPFNQA